MEVEPKQENLSKSEKVKYFKDRKEASKRVREELINLNSNVDKFSANAMHTLKYQKESLKVNGWCENCWLIKSHCLCDKLNQLNLSLSFEGENNEIDYHIWLYMHAKEYGRSTNTGILLLQALPSNTHLVIHGDEEAEKNLSLEITVSPSFVLYPSQDSISFEEFKTLMNEKKIDNKDDNEIKKDCQQTDNNNVLQNNTNDDTLTKDENNNNNKEESEQKPKDSPRHIPKKRRLFSNENLENIDKLPVYTKKRINIIILDGTWTQAKHMARELPETIKRVKLTNNINRPTISNMRTQSSEDRVTTLEAIILLLEEMKLNDDVRLKMWNLIQLRIDTLMNLGLKGKNPKHKLGKLEDMIEDINSEKKNNNNNSNNL